MALMALALPLSACSGSSSQPLGLSTTDLSSPANQPSDPEADDEPPVSPDSTVNTDESPTPEIDPVMDESSTVWRPPQISIRTIGTCLIVLNHNRNPGRVSCPGADVRGGSLRGLNLEGANLTGASIDYTAFYGTDLSGATWIDGRVCAEGSRGVCR
ncbi:MAG: pentapeptide repeat-containing protein [Candidatus Nanopelagicales bacterium]|nr:pentapeptide repeat-containing protein [Candidatus Nanopelagicales bacterium]MCF8536998.1 pentapeptide repeat-containing protein [Candidatus Nanopelagicales bacterium]MCF8542481.1 pentapeptide repeat-containing protein [Candidatus Nanopelagicales bacterium]MCF8556855.1 pentapeptide repeat-containing protein [Candidatus Nanopelagicales bacterium]